MESYGFLSVLPPVLAILLAIRTKQVYVSLVFGIGLGWLILSHWNPWVGFLNTIEAFVNVFQSRGNTRTIMFSALVGSLIVLIQRSGGVHGFIDGVERYLERLEGRDIQHKRRFVQMLAWLVGVIVFVETSISSLTVGTLFRPIFDKLHISREKLAYIADASSAATSIMIPFNAWGAFIMGLLITQGFDEPFTAMFRSMPYNFYPILTLAMVPILVWWSLDFGPMKKAELRANTTGRVIADGAKPMISEDLLHFEPVEGKPRRMMNMLIPIGVMVGMMPVMLSITGWQDAVIANPDAGTFATIFTAIGKGSGSTSVLVSVILAILVSMLLYWGQRLMGFLEMVELSIKGLSNMMPLALLMLLAFAIGAVCKSLGTGQYVAEVAKSWLSPALVPAIVFVVSAFIAFSTGTSWGTFAIMIPIAVPMAQTMDVNVYMAIAAALGGGVYGDHSSPISDTTIISSMASASDHIDHVNTQMPYALVAGGISVVLYLILGFIQ